MKNAVVISDDPAMRQWLRKLLSSYKFEVFEAAGVEQGRKCLKTQPVLLVLVASAQSPKEEEVSSVLKDFYQAETQVIYVEGATERKLNRGEMLILSRDKFNDQAIDAALKKWALD